MKCKHHKKHYEEKRSAHLQNIQTLERALESKEQDLQVCHTGVIITAGFKYEHHKFVLFSFCGSLFQWR